MERISPLRRRQRKAGGKFQSPIFCARSCKNLSIPDICLTLTRDCSRLPSTFSPMRWSGGCKKTGVKRIRIHDIRHSHASLLINQGCDALILADRLGHEKVSTTLNTYSHLFPHKQQELVSNLEQLATTVGVTPAPEPPTSNPLLETMGISNDDGTTDSSATSDTAYANAGLPYGPAPLPKETAQGKVIPMPQRKVI